MKKFIATLFVFLGFTVFFYIILIFIWGIFAPTMFKNNLNFQLGSYGHMFTRIKEVKNEKNIDLLFLGSSRAYRGFDTRIFKEAGYTAFNLGSSGQSPLQTKVLVLRYLDHLNPKFIIYEVNPELFTGDGVESSLDIISNDKNDLNTFKMAFDINHIKTYNALIYGSLRDLFDMNQSFTEPIKKDLDAYVSGGFVERKIQHYKASPFKKHKSAAINQKQLEAFNELMNLFKNRNIKVKLVFAPTSPASYTAYSDVDAFDKQMAQYSDYYNFNKILTLNDSLHFYDAHHLNQTGVEVFDKKLIELLKDKETH